MPVFESLFPSISKLMSKRWSALRALGMSNIARSSLLWFFVVPLAARVFNELPSEISIPISDQPIRFHLSLPFNWYAFYFAAFAFSAASILFMINCPAMIRKFTTFEQFKSQGFNDSFLHGYASGLLHSNHNWRTAYEKIHFAGTHEETVELFLQNASNGGSSDSQPKYLTQDQQSEIFWAIYTIADSVKLKTRRLISTLYAIGIFLILIVTVQSAWWVLQSLW